MIASLAAAAVIAPAQAPISVPFRVSDRAMFVDAVVNGANVSLMFDSGFSGAFVIGQHINVGKPTGSMTLRDFVGEFQAPTVDVTSLTFGGQKVDPAGMMVVQHQTSSMTESYGTHVDGIMGFEVIRDHVVEINFARQTFVFHPKSMDITKRQPDGEKTHLVKMLPMGNNSIELLCKTKDGKSLVLALDTGNAFYATTHRDVLERVGLWEKGEKPSFMSQSMVASGAVDSWSYLMEEAKIFGVPVKRSVWDIIDLPSSDANHDGTVGFGFLKNFNIIIDMSRRRVWLEQHTETVAPEPVGSIGIFGVYDPRKDRVRIAYVIPDSPAEKAGIRRGDDLLGIGETDIRKQGFRAILDLSEGPIGSTVTVSTSRAGQYQRHELERELLVNRS